MISQLSVCQYVFFHLSRYHIYIELTKRKENKKLITTKLTAKKTFANFVYETTLDEYGPTFNEFMNNLEITTEKMFHWISFNNLKADYSNVICVFFLINLFH